MFFIYISLFTVGFLANRNRPKLLSINPPLVFVTGPPRLQNLRVPVPIPHPGPLSGLRWESKLIPAPPPLGVPPPFIARTSPCIYYESETGPVQAMNGKRGVPALPGSLDSLERTSCETGCGGESKYPPRPEQERGRRRKTHFVLPRNEQYPPLPSCAVFSFISITLMRVNLVV